jgi:hypothetical protein
MDSLIQKARELVERKKEFIRENKRLFLEKGINYIGDCEWPEDYRKKKEILEKESQKIAMERLRMIEEAKEVLKILKVDFIIAIKTESEEAKEEMRRAIINKANKKPDSGGFIN